MNSLRERYRPLLDADYFSLIDFFFAEEVILREKKSDELLFLAAASASRCAREKHVCLDLEKIPRGEYPEGEQFEGLISYPEPSVWKKHLSGCAAVGSPGSDTPLILDGMRLYLHKYHRYETGLASSILSRSKVLPFDRDLVSSGLEILFGEKDPVPDWQRSAVMNAAVRNFSVVTGGPGTGKTTTAAKIVLLLLYQAIRTGNPCRIALCAPTGKAAAHLHTSIRKAASMVHDGSPEKQALVDEALPFLPERSHTIHRLLGSIPGSPRFRHTAENPLPYEIIIVDEVSMADIALTSKLVEAVRPDARLVFLGDMDQLSSVEAGSVLGDICEPQGLRYDEQFAALVHDLTGGIVPADDISAPRGICGSVVYLTRSRRFLPDSAIGCAARLVNEGKGEAARASIGKDPSLIWIEYALFHSASAERLSAECSDVILNAAQIDAAGSPLHRWSANRTPEEFFSALSKLQILCALRSGVYGSIQCARLVEDLLIERGYLDGGRNFRHGQTVMITRNDHSLRLFNGDIGVLCKNERGGLRALFRDHETGAFRSLSPHQLPPHESALALTVHKSQGSEYDRVVLILPGTDSPVVSKELLYTGITRARNSCVIAGRGTLFDAAVGRKIDRASALGDRLWGKFPA
jgi:exodeoxyribonuclease V alpha subunit